MGPGAETAAKRFHNALLGLYTQAGKPAYPELVSLGKRRHPQIMLNKSSLGDWLSGHTVPADSKAFTCLVACLQKMAVDRGRTVAPIPWEDLRAAARREKALNRVHRKHSSATWHADEVLRTEVIGTLRPVDALRYEVHASFKADTSESHASDLTAYLPRPVTLDGPLREAIASATQSNQLVILVGGSSTGKTRACWEAVHAVLPDWKIWHPLAPDRPQAVIEALRNKHLKPYSIVWLNEMQQYLLPQPDGPKVAAALQNLLADISEGPILLLGTMWPDYWELLVPGADGEGGLELAVANGAVGQLLEQAITITVPEAFTPTELDAVAHLVREDPRLALARQRASNGQITQFLAGAPTLWRRYEQADAPSQAILHAAIDARRFGHGRLLTEGFLKEAAAGYCKHIWDSLSDNWFELSLNKLTRNYRRLPGPLIRYRLRPDEQPITDDSLYYLADYLEEKGRIERQKIPPEQSLWVASARYSLHPTDLIQLARSAQKLKNENCVDLYVRASEYGDAAGIHWLIRTEIGRRRLVRAETLIDDHAPSGRLFAELSAAASTSGLVLDAERFAKRASLLSDPTGLRRLAYDFAASGQEETAERLYNWGAASNDMVAISWLTRRRLAQGRRQEARRFAEAALSLGFPASLMQVAHDYLSSDDAAEADHLYRKVAELGHVGALRREAEEVSRYRQHRTALHLYRVAARAGDPLALQWLSWHHDGRGEHLRAEELAHSAARLGNAHALHGLAHLRLGAGSQDEARRLNLLAASMGDTNARDWLARNSSSPSDSDDTRMPPPSS